MKININQIPWGGLELEQDIAPLVLELETDMIKFHGPVKIKAGIFRVTNVVTVDLLIDALIYSVCSRCLNDVEINLKKKTKLSYQITANEQTIDIGPDIREEIILEYPIKPLCKPECKGICPKCGRNRNEGECGCNK